MFHCPTVLSAPRRPRLRAPAVAAMVMATGLVVAATSTTAVAQSTIYHPDDRANYHVELEPHLLAGLFDPPGEGTGSGYGAGARVSFELVRNGFVKTINNSVALGVGLDFLHYSGSAYAYPGTCTQWTTGASGRPVCVEVSQYGGSSNYAFIPVVLQWNFWLTRQWSVFGEPGLALYYYDYRTMSAAPTLYLGGRFHFTDKVALTMRIGYPTFSLGVSFML